MNKRLKDQKEEVPRCECDRGYKVLIFDLDENGNEKTEWRFCQSCLNDSMTENRKLDIIHRSLNSDHIKASLTKDFDRTYLLYRKQSRLFHGNAGTGKTYLMAALFKDDIENNKQALFVSVPELLREIKLCYEPLPEVSESEVIKKYAEVKNLYLDDLGAEKVTEWVLATLYFILDYRFRNKLRTNVTTNLKVVDISKHLGDRIASRLLGLCNPIEIKGKDKRIARRTR